MRMTAGERAIWAAAYIEAMRQNYHRGVDGIVADARTARDRDRAIRGLAEAVTIATKIVQLTRDLLARGHRMGWQNGSDFQREATDMLRDMLGITEESYRAGLEHGEPVT